MERLTSKRSHSGSETRRRRAQVGIRLTDDEVRRLTERAAAAGLSPADYVRLAVLGGEARVRRPPPDPRATALRGVLAEIGRVERILRDALAGIHHEGEVRHGQV